VHRGRGPGLLSRRRESSVATSRPAGRPWNACAPYDGVGTAGPLGVARPPAIQGVPGAQGIERRAAALGRHDLPREHAPTG
jgi:hypothetical protein